MSQEVKNEILSEVNSQPVTGLSEAAANLSNALEQRTTIDYTQQTLMDVNSQPLMHSLLDNSPHHHTYSSMADNAQLLSTGAALLSQAVLGHPNSISPISCAADDDNKNNSGMKITDTTLDPSSPIITEFYEKFAMGRMFQTLEELRAEAFEYGRKHNVALTTSKSDKTKVYLICKHGGHYRKNNKRPSEDKTIRPRIRRSQKTGCACMIYARCCRGSFWIIRKSIGEHNHPIAEDPRTYAMYRSLSPEHLLLVHRLLREHVGVSFIVKSLKANGVTNILAKDIENIQQDLKRRDVLDLPANKNIAATSTAGGSSSTNPTAVISQQIPVIPVPTDASIVATISANASTVMMPNTSDVESKIE
ncbi:hypothetical protein INT46_002503 [Mucor plumbeus]|uniref:FAR1 domain-containing protein n=1 Tax=Mucor plumbeus TaxID=97098 RepID=A0A8H7R4W7_9FUNG|nr:hypothetical protein INT46_002503 [Mucor plumbeus]